MDGLILSSLHLPACQTSTSSSISDLQVWLLMTTIPSTSQSCHLIIFFIILGISCTSLLSPPKTLKDFCSQFRCQIKCSVSTVYSVCTLPDPCLFIYFAHCLTFPVCLFKQEMPLYPSANLHSWHELRTGSQGLLSESTHTILQKIIKSNDNCWYKSSEWTILCYISGTATSRVIYLLVQF